MIVLTGNDSIVQDNGRAYLMGHDLERGPDCVLAKPVDQEALIKCLSRIIKSHGGLSSIESEIPKTEWTTHSGRLSVISAIERLICYRIRRGFGGRMKIVVLGCGRVGSAMVRDLATEKVGDHRG